MPMSQVNVLQEQPLTEEQRELVELLAADLSEHIDHQSSLTDSSEQLQQDLQELENLAQASDLVGLRGLQLSCTKLAEYCQIWLDDSPSDNTDVITSMLKLWPQPLLAYMQQLLTLYDRADHSAMIELLCDERWPTRLEQTEIHELHQAFADSSITCDETSDERITEVTPLMINLAVDQHTRPELLEGLLIELPSQEQGFAEAVSGFLNQPSRESLLSAQRIAHTIKGAANVVGVSGLANLTHYTEDVLEALDKIDADKLPMKALSQLLQLVSDNLAASVEHLLGLAPRPSDSQDILQALMNWSHHVSDFNCPDDSKGLELLGGLANRHNAQSPSENQPQNPIIAVQDAPEPASQTAQLRVSENLIDQLMRLGGENLITNSRIQSRLDELESHFSQLKQKHRQLRTLADDLEQRVDIRGIYKHFRAQNQYQELDELELDSYSELHSFAHQLLELTEDSRTLMAHAETEITDLRQVALDQSGINRDNQDAIMRTRMLPAHTLSARLERCVRQTCRLTDKQAELTIIGDQLLIDSKVLSALADPLMHLLRNAIDHGIEDAESRLNTGKPEFGQLQLEFERIGENIHIRCSDDGRGLNFAAITERAQELGLSSKAPSPQQLQQLIFKPGFSTKGSVSQTSGRGVGLDVVRASLRQLKGHIQVSARDGGGCQFSMSLPISLLSSHALLVQSHKEEFSIAARGVEQIIYLEPENLFEASGQLFYNMLGEKLPVYNLNTLTKTAPGSLEQQRQAQTLLLAQNSDGDRACILVDEIKASRDRVIKPFNRFAMKSPGIIGATVLGDGRVSAVLELTDLLDYHQQLSREGENWVWLGETQEHIERPQALIVDDSLSVRKALSQFIRDMGMDVRTAKDGLEAIDLISEKAPSFMLVDLEMPRMNGLELTSHVRARNNTAEIPVIMLTSRTSQKHRQLAQEAGVDRYLSKPYSDDELMAVIQDQIAC